MSKVAILGARSCGPLISRMSPSCAVDRAEEKVVPKDVGEQALMRGLDTAFPFFRLGLSLV